MRKIILSIIFFITCNTISAQANLGVDVYSRYIWRGLDFGNSSSVQPSVSFEYKNFSAGIWGAYSLDNSASPYSEADFWLSYSFNTSFGNVSLIYTDYFFPDAGLKYFNYENKGTGAHTLEAGIAYTGKESFPITISYYHNFYNDIDNSSYLELSYPFEFENTSLSIFAGASLSNSLLYATSKAELINTGFSMTKKIRITEEFVLPVKASYILNPALEASYFIVGFSL